MPGAARAGASSLRECPRQRLRRSRCVSASSAAAAREPRQRWDSRALTVALPPRLLVRDARPGPGRELRRARSWRFAVAQSARDTKAMLSEAVSFSPSASGRGGRERQPLTPVSAVLLLIVGVALVWVLPLALTPARARVLAVVCLVLALGAAIAWSAILASHRRDVARGRRATLETQIREIGDAVDREDLDDQRRAEIDEQLDVLRLLVHKQAEELAKIGFFAIPRHPVERLIRRVRLPVAAFGFFIAWTLVYAVIWSYAPDACSAEPSRDCAGAFGGLSSSPYVRDLLYLAVNVAAANIPADIAPRSSAARLASSLEVITAVLLLAAYIQQWLLPSPPSTPSSGGKAASATD